jgi:hypothetical protein
MRFVPLLLLPALASALMAWSAPSLAQWAWRDASGRMVYSDQPPPKSVPSKNIVRQPGASPPSRAIDQPIDTAPDAAPSAQARPPQLRPQDKADREIEAKLRQQQLAETQKKAADEEARQAKAAENCERLRAYQRALDGGFRVARINAAGQQEILDDATRAAERERTLAEIEQQCR